MLGTDVAILIIIAALAEHDAKCGRKWVLYPQPLLDAWWEIVGPNPLEMFDGEFS